MPQRVAWRILLTYNCFQELDIPSIPFFFRSTVPVISENENENVWGVALSQDYRDVTN